jgi:hypothetical protein
MMAQDTAAPEEARSVEIESGQKRLIEQHEGIK